MENSQSAQNNAIALLKQGLRRSKDLEALGVSRMVLKRLVDKGAVERLGRGLYGLSGASYDENQQLLEVCQRVPKGVICLLSALQYYDLTTEMPHEIWLALEKGSWKPKLDYPPIRVFRYSAKSYMAGIEKVPVSGGVIQIYSPGKTIADCFKFRNKIGIDVAIKALKDCWRKKMTTMNELTQHAKECRVHNLMRPYLESLIYNTME